MAHADPPHNLREVSDAALWMLAHPDAGREEQLVDVMARISGPDFPTGALIMGRKGHRDAYRSGRGLISMRAVVTVEEIQNRTCLVVTELPYQVSPDALAQKIAEQVKDGRLRASPTSATGPPAERSAAGHRPSNAMPSPRSSSTISTSTALQTTFGANMLALVDGVPRTLPIDAFIRLWVEHQVDVIQGARPSDCARPRAHPSVAGPAQALDRLDDVIARSVAHERSRARAPA